MSFAVGRICLPDVPLTDRIRATYRATMLATGILADNQAIFDEAINYFYNGAGNGSIKKVIWILYNDGTGQLQEVRTASRAHFWFWGFPTSPVH